MIKEASDQVAKDRQELDEEKKKWEEEKAVMHKKFIFSGPSMILDVGGVRFSTSRSTLTKYPESMLGIMFSGRHDLETMQCKDGSFFIDRDGTHFRHILNYLRDGEEVVDSFPRSPDVLLELFHEAKFYQLDGLTTLLKPILLRQSNVVNQHQISSGFLLTFSNFASDSNMTYCTDYNDGFKSDRFIVTLHSRDKIEFKHASMRGLSFTAIRFDHPVSFINCDLANTLFLYIYFQSDVIFEDCILDNTTFNKVKGLADNSHKVSFTGSKTDKTNFDPHLRNALQSSGKIP